MNAAIQQPLAKRSPTPAELRSRLGANLRKLSRSATSISALCRELGINRTQFNRYLAGESFPRPDVLHRICDYFDVDARILLEPVEDITNQKTDLLNHPAVSDFVGGLAKPPEESALPSGFYRFSRRSFMQTDRFIQGLVYIFRIDGQVFLRGYEAKEAMASQGLPSTPAAREFRGVVLRQEDGVSALVSRHAATTATLNHLSRVPTFENNFWIGYAARPVREGVAGRRFERLVYEYLGRHASKVLPAARVAGYCTQEALVPYHRTLLAPETPIT